MRCAVYLARKLEGPRGVDVVGLGQVGHFVSHNTSVVTAVDVAQRAIFWGGVVQTHPRGEHIIAARHAEVPVEHPTQSH